MPAKKKQNGTSLTKKPQYKTVSIAQFEDLPVHLKDEEISNEFRRKAAQFRSDIKTPKNKVKSRPDGYDYIEEGYMRQMLDEHFPGWSWIPATDNAVQFLGSEWIVVSGSLIVSDYGQQRTFFSPGGSRIQFKSGQPHTAENVIDIDKQLGAANTNAFKRAINRLCRLGDDVYRKQDLDLTDEQKNKLNLFIKEHELSTHQVANVKAQVNSKNINRLNFEETLESWTKEVVNQ